MFTIFFLSWLTLRSGYFDKRRVISCQQCSQSPLMVAYVVVAMCAIRKKDFWVRVSKSGSAAFPFCRKCRHFKKSHVNGKVVDNKFFMISQQV